MQQDQLPYRNISVLCQISQYYAARELRVTRSSVQGIVKPFNDTFLDIFQGEER